MRTLHITLGSIMATGLLLCGVLAAHAQTTGAAAAAIAASQALTADAQPLAGITVQNPVALPTGRTLFWRSLGERVSLWLTTDPLKKAQKELQFAEERTRLADYIAKNSADPARQEQARQMLTRAAEYLAAIQNKKDALLKNNDDAEKNLLENVGRHFTNQQAVWERLEDRLPPEKLAEFQTFKDQALAQQNKFLADLAGRTNIPADVRAHLQAVKQRIITTMKARDAIRQAQADLVAKAQAGDAAAREKLQLLRQKLAAKMQAEKDALLKRRDDMIEKIKAGNPRAVEELKKLNTEMQQKIQPVAPLLQNLQKNLEQKMELLKLRSQATLPAPTPAQ